MAVVVYVSSVAGSILVTKAQERVERILQARKVEFTLVDVSLPENEKEKETMQSKSGKKTLPQIFVDGEYKGDIEDLENANECEEVKQWLGVA